MLVRNPEWSAKFSLLGDLLTFAEAASNDVEAPNAAPLAGVTISTAAIADLIAAADALHTAKEQALLNSIMVRVNETAAALAALPVMIEAP
jgi:hypothetical protein